MPDVIPFLTHEDGIAALGWLAEVFGFTETARLTSADGRLSHAEMAVGDGLIMLASPSPDYEAPQATSRQPAASWSALPKDIAGCSWSETRPPVIHHRNGTAFVSEFGKREPGLKRVLSRPYASDDHPWRQYLPALI